MKCKWSKSYVKELKKVRKYLEENPAALDTEEEPPIESSITGKKKGRIPSFSLKWSLWIG